MYSLKQSGVSSKSSDIKINPPARRFDFLSLLFFDSFAFRNLMKSKTSEALYSDKVLRDQADKGTVCLLLTHDKGLQKRVNESMDGVYVFDE